MCLSDDSANWRKSVYPLYKSNRLKVVKPLLLKEVKQHLRDDGAYVRPTLEADDVMGILSTHPTLIPGEKVIVSIDKDMQTIPGLLFNPQKDEKPRRIWPLDAAYFHFFQTLVGDTTDGYPGCRGIGPKKARAILHPLFEEAAQEQMGLDEIWEVMVRVFKEKGFNEAYAVTQARIARICHHTDYDYDKKEVILWQPPKLSRAETSNATN